MLVSLNWIRDFVDLPADLDSRELAERFTVTTAEVEGVEEIRIDCAGLVAGCIRNVAPVPDQPKLSTVQIDAGGGPVEIVSGAPDLAAGQVVVFAPVGARVPGAGEIKATEVAGRKSAGMIVPAEAIGFGQAAGHAVFLPEDTAAGEPIHAEPHLNDWVIEIDNKSITHRPDLWGHYGIARELAAIYRKPLKPYDVEPLDPIDDPSLPEIPIVIDDADACPRYTGLKFKGVRAKPSPLWMQARLAHVGMRPIDLTVDLTNYVMAELGQPMHAFDGDHVDRIEVGLTKAGETFTTLDGVERKLPDGAVMILSNRKPVALAGIMGGLETEITDKTTEVLLESANFDASTIRRAATAMGHRTDASARFEKSLDPANTVLGIQRFLRLARPQWPDLQMTSRLSDCFPKQPTPTRVTMNLAFLDRTMGQHVPPEEATRILKAIGFDVKPGDGVLDVGVPGFRATKDIGIEADLIEEVARFVGYGNIAPTLPSVAVRDFEPYVDRLAERRTLELFCGTLGFIEFHGYIWFDDAWLRTIGFDPGPCITLRNPAASGQARLQTTLVPNLLSRVERNRHRYASFDVIEISTVFEPAESGDRQHRCVGLMLATQNAKAEDDLIARGKAAIDLWANRVVGRSARFAEDTSGARRPWEHSQKRSRIMIGDVDAGVITAVPIECRRRMDDHLARWSICVAELRLDDVLGVSPRASRLPEPSAYPEVDLDFSVLAAKTRRYAELAEAIGGFEHALLKRLWFVDSYEGKSLPEGTRSYTFRARIGRADATLTEDETRAFQSAFTSHLQSAGLELRGG